MSLSLVVASPGSDLNLRQAVAYFLVDLCLTFPEFCSCLVFTILPTELECGVKDFKATVFVRSVSVFDRECFTAGVEVACKYLIAPGNLASIEGFAPPAGLV